MCVRMASLALLLEGRQIGAVRETETGTASSRLLLLASNGFKMFPLLHCILDLTTVLLKLLSTHTENESGSEIVVARLSWSGSFINSSYH